MGIQIRSYLYLIYLTIQIGLILLIVFIFHFPILCYTGNPYLQPHCNQLFSLYSSLSYSYINSHKNVPNYETKEGGRFWNTQKVYFSVRITNRKKLYSSTFYFFMSVLCLRRSFTDAKVFSLFIWGSCLIDSWNSWRLCFFPSMNCLLFF